jgi:hypothetical protein
MTKLLSGQVALVDRLVEAIDRDDLQNLLIFDTHGLQRPEAERGVVCVDHIIHAGDTGRADIIYALRRIAPVTAIREAWTTVTGVRISPTEPCGPSTDRFSCCTIS